jgi:hypothetical protein
MYKGIDMIENGLLIRYEYRQKCSASEKRNRNCHVFANARWAHCLLSYLLTAGIWALPRVFLIPIKNCPEAIQEPLGIP